MRVDLAAHLACPLCGASNDVAARCCTQCGGALGDARVAQGGADSPPMVPFACGDCGAHLLAERAQRPLRCPFCDADHLTEEEITGDAQTPELIIPFRVDRARATELVRQWLGFTAMRPRHVVRRGLRDGATPVYVPCWMFSALAHSAWSATVGEHWTRRVVAAAPAAPDGAAAPLDAGLRGGPPTPGSPADAPGEPSQRQPRGPRPGPRPTVVVASPTRGDRPRQTATTSAAEPRAPEPPTPQATVEVREVEWYSLAGRHHSFYAQEIVAAAGSLDPAELQAVLPLDTRGARRFELAWLEGRPVVQADAPADAALPTAQERFAAREREAVQAFLPGDEARDVRVETSLHRVQGALVLVPVWVASWSHRGRVWRILINGQSGAYTGEAPLSLLRLGAVAAILVAALAVALSLGGAP